MINQTINFIKLKEAVSFGECQDFFSLSTKLDALCSCPWNWNAEFKRGKQRYLAEERFKLKALWLLPGYFCLLTVGRESRHDLKTEYVIKR